MKISKAQLAALTFVAESNTPVRLHEVHAATKRCLYRKGLLTTSTYTHETRGGRRYQEKCLIVTGAGLKALLLSLNPGMKVQIRFGDGL